MIAGIAALFSSPQPAAAHAAPYVLRIIWSSADSGADSTIVLLTNRGLIFGNPSQHRWRLMCNEALHINTSEQPDLAYLPDGRLLIATSSGLRTTADEGCSWQNAEPYGMIATPALAQDQAAPSTLYLATYGAGQSAVRASTDAGATWTELMSVADNDFIQEILIAPSKHDRLYISGEVLDAKGHFTHYVARSDDRGATWKRHEYEVLDSEVDLTLLAVGSDDPDLILAIAVTGLPMMMQDRILVSRDGGETFDSRASFASVLGGGFSADGSTGWIAGSKGLLRSTDAAKIFAPIEGANHMSCIFERDAQTFGCGLYASGKNGVGVSTDQGASFAPFMAFTEVTEPVQCSAQSETTSLCTRLWGDWQGEIFGIWDAGTPNTAADAGTLPQSDAGTKTPPVNGTDEHKHSGCAVGGPNATPYDGLALLGSLSFLLWTHRRRQKRGGSRIGDHRKSGRREDF